MKALRDSKLGQAIFSNPELQQVVMEMWQVSKEEGIDPLKPSVTALLRSSRLREQMKKLSVVMQSSGLSPADLKEALDAIKTHQDPAKKD
ncbi:hypothetical protein PHLGIDRAFT_18509 [Phlebiopsis gigantea 11061_1 CR5-6]|uniref:Uncharacterized protein n=1 Tax=Phlebiopsis gigantea (strain 11061_1 CR5-6) TaxID=745531 RepID=A0A0C3PRL9_PHLG1|nr:hypothetical protein PHLGIDRAFT_18509 [Phlebiopsis gigantea 11061_1 CR5-6]